MAEQVKLEFFHDLDVFDIKVEDMKTINEDFEFYKQDFKDSNSCSKVSG